MSALYVDVTRVLLLTGDVSKVSALSVDVARTLLITGDVSMVSALSVDVSLHLHHRVQGLSAPAATCPRLL